MIIVFIVDQYDNENNGTTVSAARFVERLRSRGHEVRIVSTGKPSPGKYVVKERNFGPLNPIIHSHGMTLARPNKKIMSEALQGADIVHTYLPFKISLVARKLAKQANIPLVAAFHCQPENITYNIKFKYLIPLATFIYFLFYHRFYRYTRDIHCPSAFIAEQLKRHGYKSRLRIISNGVDPVFKPMNVEKPSEWRDKFVILMVGRLSEEKRQDIIIRAALRSKHRDRIQLVFLGKGPRQGFYERIAGKLKNPPVFTYINDKNELARWYNQCDLYAHSSEIEIESIACIEAISCGLIPVIADSSKSAARQFALDERALFKNKSVEDLRRKIDYWIENPGEREKIRGRYLKWAAEFSLEKSISKMEDVYREIVQERNLCRSGEKEQDEHIDYMPTSFVYEVHENYRFFNRRPLYKFASNLFYYGFAMPILISMSSLFFGLRISGRKNLKQLKEGAVTVTNHIHFMDSPMLASAIFPRRVTFASIKSNFEIPVVRHLVRILGATPIPESPRALRAFMEATCSELRRGGIVHFYPEEFLRLWNKEIRPFKNGAFHLALRSDKPVIPMVFKHRQPGKLLSIFRKKPFLTLIVGKPIFPDSLQNTAFKQRVIEMRDSARDEMISMIAEDNQPIKPELRN